MSSSTFVKKLASSDKKTRDAALESLQNFLKTKKSLSLLDLKKIWKGLYYSMWYCDRSKAQERLSENLGKLYSECINAELFNEFTLAFWEILVIEWKNLDQWRLDKFYLLIRRILRHNLKFLKSQEWDEELVNAWIGVLEKSVLSGDDSVSMALPYHMCDIFIDELQLVLFEEIQEEIDEFDEENASIEDKTEMLKKKVEIVDGVPVLKLIEPFAKLNKDAKLKTLREKCKEDVLDDERLKDWGVIEDDSDDEEDEEEEKEGNDDESEDEWNGF
ncbi:Ribosomal RNA-processing protein 1 [Candida viswanathii]|uniref:Ribosomal RNA-processing protein 1 n=1 Tax=Candida viswanathii TaxID=5486 RepID=A0A367YIF4_9ASCO|nr:Ribosomal RNA-processing protein 1 [Candida viswanathii]